MAETVQAEALQHLAAAILSSPDLAIVSATTDGRIISWNVGAERIYGYEAPDVIGRSIALLVPAERGEDLARRLAEVAAGEEGGLHESVHLTRHGCAIDVALSMSPIRDGSGRVVGVCVIARDITGQRWMEATLETTLEALEDALNDAKESAALSRRFLADAAHQLRTPIAGIQASAEALVRGAPRSSQDDLLANLLRETSRAGRLMTGLLHIAQVDQGEARAPRPCDLSVVCEQEADRLQVIAPDLDVELRLEGDVGFEAECDVDAVREILSNLVDNARRHASSCIQLSLARDDEAVEIRVSDDGPGLPEQLRERAFERFVSLDGKGGSGLGLPIARGLARAHGGDLTYEDPDFVVRLPVKSSARTGPWGGQVAPPLLARGEAAQVPTMAVDEVAFPSDGRVGTPNEV